MINGTESLKPKKEYNARGFRVIVFKDLYESDCSLQKSSIATADCIWLGVNRNNQGVNSERMHLNRKQAKLLAKYLNHFADTGELP